ncbi:DUF3794 domain-containing protein [Halanaerobaculum tunisiense]
MAQLQDFVEVVGLCEPDDFPDLTLGAFNQITVEENLTIPEQKPDIEQIMKVIIEGTVTNLRLVRTPIGVSLDGTVLTGWKVVVEGQLNQKIVYVAETEEGDQPVHSAEFSTPFSTFIIAPVDAVGALTPNDVDQIDVNICTEDVFVQQVTPREIFKNVTILLQANSDLFTDLGLSSPLTP